MQTRSQKLQSLQDKKQQCQKNVGKWPEEHGQLGIVIENSRAKDGRTATKSRRNPWSKRSWIWKSEACWLEMKGEGAAHPNQMGVAWPRPSSTVSSRQEQTWPDKSWHFSRMSSERRVECSISQRQSILCMSPKKKAGDDGKRRK